MPKHIYILWLSLIFLASSCISIKTEYPEIQYYRLKPPQTTSKNLGSISGSLQIRDFLINEEFDTDHLLSVWDDNTIQRYYYHRWVTDAASLITDFISTRFSTMAAFSNGVVSPATMVLPDFIMEGQIVDMLAHNSDNKESSNFVSISIKITLIQRVPNSFEKKIILSKVFTNKVPRKDSSVENIAQAFSKAIAEISDQILSDIHQAIAQFEKENK